MELVSIKANTAISHGYIDSEGKLVTLELNVDDVAQVPVEDAKIMHAKGLVKVAASQVEAIQGDEDPEKSTNPDSSQEANG